MEQNEKDQLKKEIVEEIHSKKSEESKHNAKNLLVILVIAFAFLLGTSVGASLQQQEKDHKVQCHYIYEKSSNQGRVYFP